MSARRRTDPRRRERLRVSAVKAKERFKALALGGSLVIGGVVAIESEAAGDGNNFALTSGIAAFVLTGFFFGIVALGIKVEDHRKG